jgi:hypothetical protein
MKENEIPIIDAGGSAGFETFAVRLNSVLKQLGPQSTSERSMRGGWPTPWDNFAQWNAWRDFNQVWVDWDNQ